MELTWIDYLVLVGFLVITLGIGIYHSLVKGRQKTVSEFLLGNRKLEVIPTAVSLFVSFISAILILGGTAEMYQFGSIFFLWAPLSLILAVLIATFIFVPWIYKLKLVSVYEYFLLRYRSTTVQMIGTILGIVRQGGMRAVIWADVFQCVVMVGGLLAILIRGTMAVGGIGKVIELCEEGGRFNWINFNPNPAVRHTIWGFMIGHTVYWLNIYALSQASVQRYSSVETLKKAKLMMLLSLPCTMIVVTLCFFTGLVVFAYYSMIRCDPLENGDVDSPNQILVHFIMTLFNDTPGVLGLFLATLYGGALSSISTSLNGCSAIMWQNIFANRITGLNEFGKALSNRIIVVLIGILSVGLAFIIPVLPGNIMQGAVAGCIGGIMTTSFFSIGAILTDARHPTLHPVSVDNCTSDLITVSNNNNLTQSTESSLFIAASSNCVNDTWTKGNWTSDNIISDSLATKQTGFSFNDLFYLSYLWQPVLGLVASFVIGIVCSALFERKGDRADERIDDGLHPFLKKRKDAYQSVKIFGEMDNADIISSSL